MAEAALGHDDGHVLLVKHFTTKRRFVPSPSGGFVTETTPHPHPYWRWYCSCGTISGRKSTEQAARTAHAVHVTEEETA